MSKRRQELIRYKTDPSISLADKLFIKNVKVLELFNGWYMEELTFNDIYLGHDEEVNRIELVLIKTDK